MKTVMIADDHPIFRAGLRQIVEAEGYQVVAEAGDGETCISSAKMCEPDVVIIDLAMPGMDGYKTLNWLVENLPDTVCVVVSMHSSNVFAKKAKEMGARAFVAKEDAATEIRNALITPKGVFYLSASVGRGSAGAPNLETREEEKHGIHLLTPTEMTVLRLVGKSKTSKEIGEEMGISYRTVHTHRQRISEKLGLEGPNNLLIFALQRQNTLEDKSD